MDPARPDGAQSQRASGRVPRGPRPPGPPRRPIPRAMTSPSSRPSNEDPPELPDLLSTEIQHPLWVRALCIAGALVCFVLGVIGWLIPLVTGLPFYAVGLILLGMASR